MEKVAVNMYPDEEGVEDMVLDGEIVCAISTWFLMTKMWGWMGRRPL